MFPWGTILFNCVIEDDISKTSAGYFFCITNVKLSISLYAQVAAVVEGLKEENVHVGCGAQSSSYVRSKKDAPISEGENY